MHLSKSSKTPCEELGYKEGDKFIAGGCVFFTDGDIVMLCRDDGSDVPLFTGENCHINNGPGKTPGAYESLRAVVKLGEE